MSLLHRFLVAEVDWPFPLTKQVKLSDTTGHLLIVVRTFGPSTDPRTRIAQWVRCLRIGVRLSTSCMPKLCHSSVSSLYHRTVVVPFH